MSYKIHHSGMSTSLLRRMERAKRQDVLQSLIPQNPGEKHTIKSLSSKYIDYL
jgi:hypothetical protein